MTPEKKAVPRTTCLSSSVGPPLLGAPETEKGPLPASALGSPPPKKWHRMRVTTERQGWGLWLSDLRNSGICSMWPLTQRAAWGHMCICEMR